MRQMKIAVGVLLIFSCIATVISYYWYRLSQINAYSETTSENYGEKTPRRIPSNVLYKDIVRGSTEDEMFDEIQEAKVIDTPGCQIPLKLINYAKDIKSTTKSVTCGERAVFLRKIDGNTVHAVIKNETLTSYMKHGGVYVDCCYQFILKDVSSSSSYNRAHKIVFSNCTKLEANSKITLQTDFINIKCYEYTDKYETYAIYDDVFAFTKKIDVANTKTSKCKVKYNVLMIGMDSMSLPRLVQSMPRTATIMRQGSWIVNVGYHKIADNTFPNLMAVFTGKKFNTIAKNCSGNMDNCNRFMIWNAFKEAGYVTAYGEDYLQLPDTFTKQYKFQEPPTDHYMRPFFLKGEYRHQNSSFICAGKISSGQQILDYAVDFVKSYKNDAFFGIYWINSFSHDSKSRPHEADKIIENFLNQLEHTKVFSKTFIIFFSDHGIRFGEQRFNMESYYDDRLPMLYLWVPQNFKSLYTDKLRALHANQYRLMTPYDIYSTLLQIKQISTCSNITDDAPEGCPQCHSTFEVLNYNRTCKDVSIHPKWCSCHNLYPLAITDTEGLNSVEVVLNHIKTMATTVKTQPCWGCMSRSLAKVYRMHFYYDKDKVNLYHVVAFSMTPGNVSYEATVMRKNDNSQGIIIGPVSVISSYRGLGKCVINHRDRLFCICQKIDKC